MIKVEVKLGDIISVEEIAKTRMDTLDSVIEENKDILTAVIINNEDLTVIFMVKGNAANELDAQDFLEYLKKRDIKVHKYEIVLDNVSTIEGRDA